MRGQGLWEEVTSGLKEVARRKSILWRRNSKFKGPEQGQLACVRTRKASIGWKGVAKASVKCNEGGNR